MIDYIDDLCKLWAREIGRLAGGHSNAWAGVSAGVMSSGYSCGTIPLSSEAVEMDTAIARLRPVLKSVVMQQYLGCGNSVESAQAVGVSKKRYYDLLHTAHVEIDEHLCQNECY